MAKWGECQFTAKLMHVRGFGLIIFCLLYGKNSKNWYLQKFDQSGLYPHFDPVRPFYLRTCAHLPSKYHLWSIQPPTPLQEELELTPTQWTVKEALKLRSWSMILWAIFCLKPSPRWNFFILLILHACHAFKWAHREGVVWVYEGDNSRTSRYRQVDKDTFKFS